MRAAFLLATTIALAACGNSAGTCHWPSSVPTATDAAMLGCFAGISVPCTSSEYFLHCAGPATPDLSLRCRMLVYPGVKDYCCPCVQ
jgi:hypothetical protein